jgi:transposase-like protein DUF772
VQATIVCCGRALPCRRSRPQNRVIMSMQPRPEVPDEAARVRGAPGISPAQLAMVTVSQFCENLTDRQAADEARGRVDWKYCLSLELADEGFEFTALNGVPGPAAGRRRRRCGGAARHVGRGGDGVARDGPRPGWPRLSDSCVLFASRRTARRVRDGRVQLPGRVQLQACRRADPVGPGTPVTGIGPAGATAAGLEPAAGLAASA